MPVFGNYKTWRQRRQFMSLRTLNYQNFLAQKTNLNINKKQQLRSSIDVNETGKKSIMTDKRDG